MSNMPDAFRDGLNACVQQLMQSHPEATDYTRMKRQLETLPGPQLDSLVTAVVRQPHLLGPGWAKQITTMGVAPLSMEENDELASNHHQSAQLQRLRASIREVVVHHCVSLALDPRDLVF